MGERSEVIIGRSEVGIGYVDSVRSPKNRDWEWMGYR